MNKDLLTGPGPNHISVLELAVDNMRSQGEATKQLLQNILEQLSLAPVLPDPVSPCQNWQPDSLWLTSPKPRGLYHTPVIPEE